jgi:hypothetical protein
VKPGNTPIRWPSVWSDTSVLRDTAIEAVDAAAPPSDVVIIKGEWPGIRSAQEAGGGPTGAAWVDSNGWASRLAAARNPGKSIWIDATPSNKGYVTAMADAAAFGARWIATVDSPSSPALQPIAAAARFFADHREWESWPPQALIGVLSKFESDFSQELLNLLDRQGMHNRVLLKGHLPADPFRGLRAVLYADPEPLSETLRKQIGTLLIAPKSEDPYEVASAALIQVSHRYDLVRCWNTGAMSSNYVISPDQSRAVVHLIFYSDWPPDSASVRITGRWRAAKISTVEQPALQAVKLVPQKDAVEVHLPQVPHYVALQLEA